MTVAGIDSVILNNGASIFFPLAQFQRMTNSAGTVNTLWLTTKSTSGQFVNQVSDSVQTRLGQAGYSATIQKSYVETAQNESGNNSIVTLVEVLGLLVVGIALIGLVGTLTLALIERTREVGILRCLSAGARQIRRVFNAEAVVMATAGWALGSLLGYALFLGLVAFIEHDFGLTVTKVFPVLSVPVALIAVIAVTLLVVRPTLRRAVRIDPGRALRYSSSGPNTTHVALVALRAPVRKHPDQFVGLDILKSARINQKTPASPRHNRAICAPSRTWSALRSPARNRQGG